MEQDINSKLKDILNENLQIFWLAKAAQYCLQSSEKDVRTGGAFILDDLVKRLERLASQA